MSLGADVQRLSWFRTGLSEDEIKDLYLTKKENYANFDINKMKNAVSKGLGNLRTFYNQWKIHFENYQLQLEDRKIHTSGLNSVKLSWSDGVESYLQKTDELLRSATDISAVIDILKGMALVRAQTISKWFYFIQCEIYGALESRVRQGKGKNKGHSVIKESYKMACEVASESQIVGTLFQKFPQIDESPPMIDIDADIAKVRRELGVPEPEPVHAKKMKTHKPVPRNLVIIMVTIAVVVMLLILFVVHYLLIRKKKSHFVTSDIYRIPEISRIRVPSSRLGIWYPVLQGT
jgi:hypothetical protein